ncbi:hypothetical protein [Acinetobacter tianfuensis]|uniref:hypothetical protein n=1 Tax=Acinetobacter tianfuensis TaxID=2419603 RepID=UPI00148D1DDD|nr:hypothetical protein [Acinetobacter tianfuensis]
MQTFQIGQKVAFSSMPNYEFVIKETKIDGSYVLETQLGSGQILSYDNVSVEMLKILD